MSEGNDTARRLIANLIKYTKPGQLELPLDWISDDSKDDVIKNDHNEFNKKSGESTVAGKIFEADEKLQDAELLKKKDEGMEKENTQTLGFTCFVSAKGNNNDGSDINGNITSKAEKDILQAKRQKYGHVLCKFFREGICSKGDTCSYSHDAGDSHRQPELCKEYKHGTCRTERYLHQHVNDFSKPIFKKILVDAREANATVFDDTRRQIPPPFSSSSSNNSVNYPPKFSNHQSRPFSSSTNVIRRNHSSSSYNKNSFRHYVTYPYI